MYITLLSYCVINENHYALITVLRPPGSPTGLHIPRDSRGNCQAVLPADGRALFDFRDHVHFGALCQCFVHLCNISCFVAAGFCFFPKLCKTRHDLPLFVHIIIIIIITTTTTTVIIILVPGVTHHGMWSSAIMRPSVWLWLSVSDAACA